MKNKIFNERHEIFPFSFWNVANKVKLVMHFCCLPHLTSLNNVYHLAFHCFHYQFLVLLVINVGMAALTDGEVKPFTGSSHCEWESKCYK